MTEKDTTVYWAQLILANMMFMQDGLFYTIMGCVFLVMALWVLIGWRSS